MRVIVPDTELGALQRVGAVEMWRVSVNMPAMTAKVNVSVTIPTTTGEEARLSVVAIHILDSRNVPCGSHVTQVISTSTVTTNNQQTFISSTFFVSNTGRLTSRIYYFFINCDIA